MLKCKQEVSLLMTKKLMRSSTDKVVAGVCGGLGEYFEVDPKVVWKTINEDVPVLLKSIKILIF